jgi:hemolysin activation/secretion protein
LMGGADTHEDRTSVKGAHGQYTRNHLTVARRQKVWNGIDFVAKAHWQESSERLTGVNVFSMGGFMGVIDQRGYPRAQFPGDRGRSLTGGFSVPPFGISRTLKVPGSKTTWYDDIRFFNFVDYSIGVLKTANPGEDREATLVSAGLGMTFSVPDKALSMRLDVGWPVSNDKPADGDGYHVLYSITKGF